MKNILNDPAIHDAIVTAVTGVIFTVAAMIKRKLEKAKLRKEGKLNDGK